VCGKIKVKTYTWLHQATKICSRVIKFYPAYLIVDSILKIMLRNHNNDLNRKILLFVYPYTTRQPMLLRLPIVRYRYCTFRQRKSNIYHYNNISVDIFVWARVLLSKLIYLQCYYTASRVHKRICKFILIIYYYLLIKCAQMITTTTIIFNCLKRWFKYNTRIIKYITIYI